MTSAGGPSASATFPSVRFGRRWLSLLWTIPVVAIVLLAAFGLATFLRTLEPVQQFITDYPGSVANHAPQGFPWWLRWQHLLNAIFLIPIARAGLQLWAGRPRAYWRKPGVAGRDWARMQRAMPAEGGWGMRDDAVALPALVGLPGKRLSSAVARWWHLGVTILWVANGILFYIVLFATGQWQRIVPTSPDVFPNALSGLLQYLSFDFPATNSWVAYNSLQLLTYFVTVFVAAPLAVLTGLMHSPAIAKRLENRLFNAEVGKSVHLLVLGYFIVFVIVHVTLVLITGALVNLNHITLGTNDGGWAGLILFAIAVVTGGVFWAALSPLTLRFPAAVQKAATRLLGPIGKLF